MDKDLIKFLEHHKIECSDVIDAEGRSVSEIRELMKERDILFAYNTTPCEKAGHTIRDRNSHCIMCDTTAIAFMKRTRVTGFVYIAGSLSRNFIKVGMTTESIDKRISKLNSRKVGNTADWVAIKIIKCDHANIVELGIHERLGKYSVTGEVSNDDTESTEIFRCSYQKANEVVEKFFNERRIIKREEKILIIDQGKYNAFRNLVNPKFLGKT